MLDGTRLLLSLVGPPVRGTPLLPGGPVSPRPHPHPLPPEDEELLSSNTLSFSVSPPAHSPRAGVRYRTQVPNVFTEFPNAISSFAISVPAICPHVTSAQFSTPAFEVHGGKEQKPRQMLFQSSPDVGPADLIFTKPSQSIPR